MKILVQAVESEPQLLTVVLPRLLGDQGTYIFDKVTKTKTIEKLLSTVDSSNAEAVIEILLSPVKVMKS